MLSAATIIVARTPPCYYFRDLGAGNPTSRRRTMDLYTLLKTLHVISAAIWVGTAIQQQFAAARARATNDQRRMVEFIDEAEFYGKRLFAPVSMVTAAFGILLVIVGWPNFNDLWVLIGIALWIVTVIIGAGFLTPESGRIRDLVVEKGLQDAQVQSRISRITMVTRIDATLLILVVADMVIKPTF